MQLAKPIAASSRIDGDQFAEVYLKPVNEGEYLESTSSVLASANSISGIGELICFLIVETQEMIGPSSLDLASTRSRGTGVEPPNLYRRGSCRSIPN